jgi:ribosomal protein S27AE
MQKRSTWRELYLLEILVVGMFLLFIPVFAIASKWLGSHSPFWICLIWGGIWLRLGYVLANWKCPNCNNRFLTNEKNTVTVPFRIHCANCGIRRGSSVPSNGIPHNFEQPVSH